MAPSARTYLQNGIGRPKIYLFVIFFVAPVLSAEVLHKIVFQEFHDSQESGESSNSVPSTASSTSVSRPTLPPPQSTLEPRASAFAEKSGNFAALQEYLEGIRSPLEEEALENSLDYYNEKALIKEYDFEPTKLWERLASSAKAQGTPPSQFLQEIQDLISLQNRSRSEQDDPTGKDEIPKLPSGYLSENLLKRMTEGWKNELKRIEQKYNISAECTGPESITSTRLALMFPHYINFGQKPFTAPSNISFDSQEDRSPQTVCGPYRCHNEYPDLNTNIPSIVGRAEFGGLIPLGLLSKPNGKVIIGTHLYALHRNDFDDVVPFRTKCVMLKRRMEKSMLSDDRRFRFLINNNIIHSNGTLLRASIKTLFDKIPNDFKDKIDWEYLGGVQNFRLEW